MKSFAIACALMLFAASASAADAVSESTLGSMGLGKMQSMSDNDGLAVRGKGTFANVLGTSATSFHGQTASNSYEAGAQWLGKGSRGGGESLSFSTKVELLYAADPTGFALQVSAAGGISGGSAKAWAY
jgi:hypothetical protein